MKELALLGGTPIRKEPLPKWPVYDSDEENGLLEVLHSRNWGGYPSPNIQATKFAAQFAEMHHSKYGVCAANGTVTLELALKAAGIKAGDEVIVPAYTWLATAAAVVYINAVPVIVDINPEDYTIDCDQVEAAITSKTRAIIPVHIGSFIADLDRLKAICKKNGLILIEDCAHAHGAQWNGKAVGSHGDMGSFSFQSSKIMTAGEGGLIITDCEEYHEKLQSLVNCGRKAEGKHTFDGWTLGYNYRLSEFQAAILCAQLKKLPTQNRLRAENAAYLTRLLEEIEGIEVMKPRKEITCQSFYQYAFKYKRKYFRGVHRDLFLAALKAEGIDPIGALYQPLQEWDLFAPKIDEWPLLKERYPNGIQSDSANTPVAHLATNEEGVWLPQYHLLGTKKDVEDIAAAIIKIKSHIGEISAR